MARSRNWEAFASAGSKTEPEFTLTDGQWSLIADLLPEPEASPEGGRPPAPSRAWFEGICWVLQMRARWKDLPGSFPSPSTCWRRLRDWTDSGAWERHASKSSP
jgi:transposase